MYSIIWRIVPKEAALLTENFGTIVFAQKVYNAKLLTAVNPTEMNKLLLSGPETSLHHIFVLILYENKYLSMCQSKIWAYL